MVITGDDFGLSHENNAGIMAAHHYGTLTTTCLMVRGEALDEAIDMAQHNPSLAVGLHISLSDTKPVLPPEQVPMLVQADGRFPPDDRAHKRALLTSAGRRQVQAEIAAQFHAFHATGLVCDHVNTHRHVHRHPLLAWMLFQEAARWSIDATRIPWDPPADPVRGARFHVLRWLAYRCRLRTPDRSIGRDWGCQRLVEWLAKLPHGVTELYFHPVALRNHKYAVDLPMLLDDRLKLALTELTLCRGLRQACRS